MVCPHLGLLCVQVLGFVSQKAWSPAGHPGYHLEVAVTDRLCQCWTRGPLACPHEARAKQLAVVMHFRDPRQKPQLRTTSCKNKAINTGLIPVLGPLLLYRSAVTEGPNPSWQCCSVAMNTWSHPTNPVPSMFVSRGCLPGSLSLSAHDHPTLALVPPQRWPIWTEAPAGSLL